MLTGILLLDVCKNEAARLLSARLVKLAVVRIRHIFGFVLEAAGLLAAGLSVESMASMISQDAAGPNTCTLGCARLALRPLPPLEGPV